MSKYIKRFLTDRIVRYLVVGGLLFIFDFVCSLFFYYVLHLDPGIASGTGFLLGFLIGFTLNKKVVFLHNSNSRFSVRVQVTLYLLLALLNLIVSASLVHKLVRYGFRIEYVKIFVTGAIAGWNYIILGRYIFGLKPVEYPFDQH